MHTPCKPSVEMTMLHMENGSKVDYNSLLIVNCGIKICLLWTISNLNTHTPA